jgi:glycosyltransferase involved in cell wall biosynthesis
LKLLIIAKQYIPDISAQSIRISQIARRFHERDKSLQIKVVVFDPEGRKIGRNEGSENGIDVERLSRNRLPTSTLKPQSLNPLLLALWIRIASREMREFKPDIVIATTPPFTPSIAVYIASRIGGKKVAYAIDYRDDLGSVIDSLANNEVFWIRYPLKAANWIMSFFLLQSVKNAILLSTVNDSLRKGLLKDNKNVVLVPNGLDVEELADVKDGFDRTDILTKNGIFDLESRNIVYLGDLSMPYYMPEAILMPMKKLMAQGYRIAYIVIGDGSRSKVIKEQAKELGIESSVYLLGRKNHKEAMELLMACDVAFHTLQKGDPQSRHAIATKIYEYLGCKLPILAVADHGSAASEFINNEKVGISVNWDELESVEASLREILDHPDIYEHNLEAKYQYFLDKFDRNRGIDLLYENMMALVPQKRD